MADKLSRAKYLKKKPLRRGPRCVLLRRFGKITAGLRSKMAGSNCIDLSCRATGLSFPTG